MKTPKTFSSITASASRLIDVVYERNCAIYCVLKQQKTNVLLTGAEACLLPAMSYDANYFSAAGHSHCDMSTSIQLDQVNQCMLFVLPFSQIRLA